MQTRRHVHYSGDVQGVGFRYAAIALARGRPVAGFVRNLRDGRVEMVVEGEEGEVARLLAAVEEEMGGHIREAQVVDEPATGDFVAFRVAY